MKMMGCRYGHALGAEPREAAISHGFCVRIAGSARAGAAGLTGARTTFLKQRASRAGGPDERSPSWSRASDLWRSFDGVAKGDRCPSRLRIVHIDATASEIQIAANGAGHGDHEHGGHEESEEEVVLSRMELWLLHDDPRLVDNTQTKSPEAFDAIRAFLPVRSS